jgi:dinuclear metal center YbgI/SA1388 family protein
MLTVGDLCDFLESFAPAALAAEWDNVGLLVGDRGQGVERVMTCLTLTREVAAEAVRERAELIVTHHPLPFRPLKRVTADEPGGRILLDLILAGVAVHSPHTAFDSAAAGINQQLAEGLGLVDIQPLEPVVEVGAAVGSGRFGSVSGTQTLDQVGQRLKEFLDLTLIQAVGDPQMPIQRVAVGCGSAGEFLPVAAAKGCQVLVTGETRLHTCYDAANRGMGLLLCGHYASERFGVENLAGVLAAKFPGLRVWASREEQDPLSLLCFVDGTGKP